MHDRYAIAVLEDDTLCTVGHLPREMSQECFYFIRRGGTISVEVTGPRQKSATEGKAWKSHVYLHLGKMMMTLS